MTTGNSYSYISLRFKWKKLFTVGETTEPQIFDEICIAVLKLFFIVPCRQRWFKMLTGNSHTSEVWTKVDLALSINKVQ